MLSPEKIATVARNAAHVAYTVLGLDCPYSITFINKPELAFDGLLSNQENVIQLNLAHLKPFSTAVMPTGKLKTEEEYELDENYRHAMKIYSVVFHEMRHLYQKRAVEIYHLNPSWGRKASSLWKATRNALYGSRNYSSTSWAKAPELTSMPMPITLLTIFPTDIQLIFRCFRQTGCSEP